MITITIDYDPKNERESAKIEEIAEVIQEILDEKAPEEFGRLYPDGTMKLNLEKVEMTEEGLKIKGRYQDVKDRLKEIGIQTEGVPGLKIEKNRFSFFSDEEKILLRSLLAHSKEAFEQTDILAPKYKELMAKMPGKLIQEIDEARK